MRRLVLSISILLGAACSPGSGEYGSCGSTPDCQVNLFCTNGTTVVTDGGPNSFIDGGVCRHSCQIQNDCQNGEICNTTLMLCSKDGGY